MKETPEGGSKIVVRNTNVVINLYWYGHMRSQVTVIEKLARPVCVLKI